MIKYSDKEQFKLSSKLQYQHNGDFADCEHLDIFAPTRSQFSEVIKLKQGYFKAQGEVAARYMPLMKNIEEIKSQLKKEDEQEQQSIDAQAKQIIEAIYTSDIDIEEYFKQFKLLCVKGAVKTPLGTAITELLLDKLSINDLERLLGEYLAFFIVGSTAKTN
jgi:hypothetical protein